MTTTILSFNEADYDDTDIFHFVAQYQHGAAEPARLWLGQRQAGKVTDMVKHRLPFEDSIEGQVIVAMKQGVIDAVVEAIKARVNSSAALNPQELYGVAVKALDEVEKLQESLDSNVDHDVDTE